MNRARVVLVGLLLVASAMGCVMAEDNPTRLRDLRVIGMRFEPPEVLMQGCDARLLLGSLAGAGAADGGSIAVPPQFQLLIGLYAATPLKFEALIADPSGGGRDLNYRLLGCANRGDRNCDNEGDYVLLEEGITKGGVLSTTVAPGIQFLNDGTSDAGTPLLIEVIQQDTFKGLGGIRVPVVLELSAPDTGEKIYAQKLMVYTCQFFPTMTQNVTPRLPGVLFNKVPWGADELIEIRGRSEWEMVPEDFTALEEPYVVPTIQLKPLELVESWKVTWMTSSGTMSPYTTGGTDFVGTTGRHRAVWTPDQISNEPTDVTFHIVVRDGRGGSSWLTRFVKWYPE